MNFELSVFRPFWSAKAERLVPGTVPERHVLDWQKVVKALTHFRELGNVEKTELPSWSPTRYAEGAKRGVDGVLEVTMLVLDIDGGAEIDEVSGRWGDWPHIIYTTWSHTPEQPKFRLVLPLERPVPAALWGRVFAWARRREPSLDPKCSDPSRVYFLPAVRDASQPRFATVVDPGGWMLGLEAEQLAETEEERQARARRERPPLRLPNGPARDRVLNELLKTNAALRERAGLMLGGRVRGGRVEDVRCPSCGRDSVFWMLSPSSWGGAACQHRNSCGWSGWLDQLLDAREAA